MTSRRGVWLLGSLSHQPPLGEVGVPELVVCPFPAHLLLKCRDISPRLPGIYVQNSYFSSQSPLEILAERLSLGSFPCFLEAPSLHLWAHRRRGTVCRHATWACLWSCCPPLDSKCPRCDPLGVLRKDLEIDLTKAACVFLLLPSPSLGLPRSCSWWECGRK